MSNSVGLWSGSPARRFRAPAVLTALLVSLVLLATAGPALGAKNGSSGGGNGASSTGGGSGSSTVKIQDAATGLETSGSDNEPHVCAFRLEFSAADSYEAGTWVIVSWPPTGDGSTVVAGTYDTSGDGSDQSAIITVPAGHYRVEWAAAGAIVTNKKTFWVDDCNEETAPPEESSTEPPATPVESSPAEEPVSQQEDPVVSPDESPVDEPVPPPDESPVEEPATPADESPAEDAAPTSDLIGPEAEASGSPDEGVVADGAEIPVDESIAEVPLPPADESIADALPPVDESSPEDLAQGDDQEGTDPMTPPAQEQLDGNGHAGEPTIPDTALREPAMPGGPLTIIAVLALIVSGVARPQLLRPRV